MSYFHYLACSHPLPCGLFGAAPKAIYDSYAQYCNSGDYFPPTDPFGPIPLSRIEARQNRYRQLKGKVLVYEKAAHMRHTAIRSFPDNHTEDETFLRITSHFSLPNVYTCFNLSLDYLLSHLRPGDQAEYMIIWNDEEASPRHLPDIYVDLQDYIDGRYSEDDLFSSIRRNPGNSFVHFIPPRTSGKLPVFPELHLPSHICTICLETGLEGFDLQKVHEQGLL